MRFCAREISARPLPAPPSSAVVAPSTSCSGPSSPPFFAAMEAFQLADLVNVEVAHMQSCLNVAPAVALVINVLALNRKGNIVVQGGIPTGPAGKEVASGATAAVRSARPPAGKMSKVSGMKRKKVPTKKPSATPSALTRRSPTVTFYGAASTTRDVFDQTVGSGGSNNAAAELVHLLATNAIDIDQARIAGSDYSELEGGVDDHGGEDEVKEVDAGTYQQSGMSQTAKSVRLKNYTILEDEILIKAWSTVSMDPYTGVSQIAKTYWQRIEYQYFEFMAKYPNGTARTFWSLQGHWDVIKSACSRCTACLEEVYNAPPSGTVESDYASWFMSKFSIGLHNVK
ncbi:glutathione s-transferase t3-like [Hordeum vulgare]|nr:glutathione s-transferase t3-like [Hordeum vulgare]